MRRIVACTDGSAYAPSVYGHAAWAAERLGLGVRAVHVVETLAEPRPRGFDPTPALLQALSHAQAAQAEAARQLAEALLADAGRLLRQAGIGEPELERLEGGLVEVLQRLEGETALLVVGKRGQEAARAPGHLGSNLERVLRGSETPVLVAGETHRPVRRAIFAFDGRPGSLRAIDCLRRAPLLRGVECHLLTAGEAGPVLAEAASRLAESGAVVQAEALPGDPRAVIPAALERRGADLLVMGAYGHGRLHGMFLGSTTTALLQAATVPALVLR